jgi:ureidoacrylate peracid hydrolase
MTPSLAQVAAPATSALLVIDVQNDYVHPDGALSKAGLDTSACRAVVPAIQRLLSAARGSGVFVVHTRNWHRDATDSGPWRDRILRTSTPETRPGRADTWGAAFYEIAPRDGEEIVSKARYDAFLGTNLEMILRAREIRTVICGGVTTNVCVESTARSAHLHDFNLVVVSDCCGSPEPELHAATLENVRRHFGTVVESRDLIEAWASPSASAAGSGQDRR